MTKALRQNKCRTCEIDNKFIGKSLRHTLSKVNLVCPVCSYNGKWASHLCDDLWGDSIECRKCHDYIFYSSPTYEIWKDEIFFPDELLLIRDYEDNVSSLIINHETIFKVPMIIPFDNYKKLEDRLRTMVVFS